MLMVSFSLTKHIHGNQWNLQGTFFFLGVWWAQSWVCVWWWWWGVCPRTFEISAPWDWRATICSDVPCQFHVHTCHSEFWGVCQHVWVKISGCFSWSARDMEALPSCVREPRAKMHHGRVGHGFGTRLLVGLLRSHLFPICSRHFATAEKNGQNTGY